MIATFYRLFRGYLFMVTLKQTPERPKKKRGSQRKGWGEAEGIVRTKGLRQ